MDHVTKGPCGVSTGLFRLNRAGWVVAWPDVCEGWHMTSTKNRNDIKKHVQNLLFLGFLAAMKL